MSSIASNPILLIPGFHEIFPNYHAIEIDMPTPGVFTTLSGQVHPQYGLSQDATTIQHFLPSQHEKENAVFEERKRPKTSITLAIITSPQNPHDLASFTTLLLTYLMSALKYKPNATNPIILRGRPELKLLQYLTALIKQLALEENALSNRTSSLRFFQYQPTFSHGSPPFSEKLLTLIEHYKTTRLCFSSIHNTNSRPLTRDSATKDILRLR